MLPGLTIPVYAQGNDCLTGEDAYIRHIERGGIAYGSGEMRDAEREYTCAIQLRPDHPLAYNSRGRAREVLGLYDLAIEDYTVVLDLQPDYVAAYNNRGRIYYLQQQFGQAIADFNRAIEIDPTYALAYNNRGLVHLNIGHNDQAIADFEMAIELELDPIAWAYTNLGVTYNVLEEYGIAIEYFDAALNFDPGVAEAWRRRGDAYYALNQTENALESYQRYAEVAGDRAAPDVLERVRELESQQTAVQILPTIVIGLILVAFVIDALMRKRHQAREAAAVAEAPHTSAAPAVAEAVPDESQPPPQKRPSRRRLWALVATPLVVGAAVLARGLFNSGSEE